MIVNPLFRDILVLIKGGGDLASGVAYRLKRAGFPMVMAELPAPLLVRRTVSFGDAAYTGTTVVEGITARRVLDPVEAAALATTAAIPVLVDPQGLAVAALKPAVLVDGIMAKANMGTRINDALLVIALGPGFVAGVDCHVVVETRRGHRLGRLIDHGAAAPDTGRPGKVGGRSADRVLRAPAAGHLAPAAAIGDKIDAGVLIGTVDGLAVRAPFDGVLRGLIHPDAPVVRGMKIGDLDPRREVDHCFAISDKSLAIGGAVLEAVLARSVMRTTVD